MGQSETDPEAIDYAAAAQQAYEEAGSFDELDPVEVVVDQNVRSVVSVRFNRGELAAIEAASQAAGLPLSTYIRVCALEAAKSPAIMNVAQLTAAVALMQQSLELVGRYVSIRKDGVAEKIDAPAKSGPAAQKARAGSALQNLTGQFTGRRRKAEADSRPPASEPGSYRDPNGPIRLGARRRLAIDLLPFDHEAGEAILNREEAQG